jgi:tRNA pseudouridine55 synthase
MLSPQDFLEGQVLLIDKPLRWTSFDVVNKLRFALRKYTQEKKIKVGHAGTLDPLATGLLIICTGKMTKQIDSFKPKKKSTKGKSYSVRPRPPTTSKLLPKTSAIAATYNLPMSNES